MDERWSDLVGSSSPIAQLRSDILQAATSDARTLITGESGTGKEVATRMVHNQSARARQPFVAINCAGLTETLLESELFGHHRGSFTGAVHDKQGLIERAHRGTIFLDEVGEMSARMQGLLLRVLETGEIQRVGADKVSAHVDVRVIAATNRNLAERVRSGDFRLDLFYRLHVLELKTPALRDHREDVPELVTYFLRRYALHYSVPVPAVDNAAMTRLQGYSWPGNVRQLKNLAERFVVSRQPRITTAHLPADVTGSSAAPAARPMRNAPVERALDRMLSGRDPFWAVVYGPFMSRDLTRDDVRAVVARGLELTRGSYTGVVQLFNMPPDDYKRFQNFLRKHQCHVGFHPFRTSTVLPIAAAPRQ